MEACEPKSFTNSPEERELSKFQRLANALCHFYSFHDHRDQASIAMSHAVIGVASQGTTEAGRGDTSVSCSRALVNFTEPGEEATCTHR